MITVGDTTAAAFGCLLAYLYSDELELVDAVVIDVMRKAQEFGLSVTSCDLVYYSCRRRQLTPHAHGAVAKADRTFACTMDG